jgi:hypothetical protein
MTGDHQEVFRAFMEKTTTFVQGQVERPDGIPADSV